MHIRHILVATDFSEGSAKAEHRAARLCQSLHCDKAEMLTVESQEGPDILALINKNSTDKARLSLLEQALLKLRLRAEGLREKYQVTFDCIVRIGQTAHEVIEYSKEAGTHLLVAGAHGGHFFADLLLGNTVDKLARMTQSPLLVVKNDPKSEYGHILVPVDFSKDSKQAARFACMICPNASITLLHAYDVWYEGKMYYANAAQETIDFHRRQAHENASLSMSRFIHELGEPNRIISRQLEFDMPSAAIRKYTEKFQPDLIVIGKHGRSRMEELLIGSVTRDTISQVACDILVVPSTVRAATAP